MVVELIRLKIYSDMYSDLQPLGRDHEDAVCHVLPCAFRLCLQQKYWLRDMYR